MRTFITMVVLLALLDGPQAIAQTIGSTGSSAGAAAPAASSLAAQDVRLIGSAPVGHRQPRVSDIPSGNANDLEHVSAEDAAVDRRIIICRGC